MIFTLADKDFINYTNNIALKPNLNIKKEYSYISKKKLKKEKKKIKKLFKITLALVEI